MIASEQIKLSFKTTVHDVMHYTDTLPFLLRFLSYMQHISRNQIGDVGFVDSNWVKRKVARIYRNYMTYSLFYIYI